jgi:hypothetical protein
LQYVVCVSWCHWDLQVPLSVWFLKELIGRSRSVEEYK